MCNSKRQQQIRRPLAPTDPEMLYGPFLVNFSVWFDQGTKISNIYIYIHIVCSIKRKIQKMRKTNKSLSVFPTLDSPKSKSASFWGCYILEPYPSPMKMFLHTQWEAARCSCRARVSSSKTPGSVEGPMSQKMWDEIGERCFQMDYDSRIMDLHISPGAIISWISMESDAFWRIFMDFGHALLNRPPPHRSIPAIRSTRLAIDRSFLWSSHAANSPGTQKKKW